MGRINEPLGLRVIKRQRDAKDFIRAKRADERRDLAPLVVRVKIKLPRWVVLHHPVGDEPVRDLLEKDICSHARFRCTVLEAHGSRKLQEARQAASQSRRETRGCDGRTAQRLRATPTEPRAHSG
jgi:hypothetical protein